MLLPLPQTEPDTGCSFLINIVILLVRFLRPWDPSNVTNVYLHSLQLFVYYSLTKVTGSTGSGPMARIKYFHVALLFIPVMIIYISALYLDLNKIGITRTIRHAMKDKPPPLEMPKHPIWKTDIDRKDSPLIIENFPLAARAASIDDLPPIPSWNQPPKKHIEEKTPLLIGFTRNWRILQQAVVGYITAGWPPEDIYVLENTGTMDSNEKGKLSLQNPFFLNHTRLNKIFGVNVISTPTLLTFAQLQNFMLHTAIKNKWPHYFWSHMDVGVLSWEDREPYVSLYAGAVEKLRNTTTPEYGKWAQVLYAYDRLALVNTEAYEEVGGWDTQIPFYGTDCDMHERLDMAGFRRDEIMVGQVNDVGSSVDDLIVFYRKANGPEPSFIDPNKPINDTTADTSTTSPDAEEVNKPEARRKGRRGQPIHLWSIDYDEIWPEHVRGDDSFLKLLHTIEAMDHAKNDPTIVRNQWQHRQTGGKGEPYYKDPAGFEKALWMWVEHGRRVMEEKWGHRGCDLIGSGLRAEYAWKVQKDWEMREKMEKEREEKW